MDCFILICCSQLSKIFEAIKMYCMGTWQCIIWSALLRKCALFNMTFEDAFDWSRSHYGIVSKCSFCKKKIIYCISCVASRGRNTKSSSREFSHCMLSLYFTIAAINSISLPFCQSCLQFLSGQFLLRHYKFTIAQQRQWQTYRQICAEQLHVLMKIFIFGTSGLINGW